MTFRQYPGGEDEFGMPSTSAAPGTFPTTNPIPAGFCEGLNTPIVDPNYIKDLFKGPTKLISDGSVSEFYDFPKGALTLNDLLEYKGDKQWKGDSFHLSNIVKATWRWGQKSGIDEAYDSRKIIYSGCRLLMKYAGVTKLRETLQALLDDPQFKERDTK